MAEKLENLANNKKEAELSVFRKLARKVDSFVDSNLGIASLVLATPVAYFAGYQALGPVVDVVLTNVGNIIGSDIQGLNSSEDMPFSNYLAGLSGVLIYGKYVGDSIQGCVKRNRGFSE